MLLFFAQQQQDSSHPTLGTVSNSKADGCELLVTRYCPASLPLLPSPFSSRLTPLPSSPTATSTCNTISPGQCPK